jgi:aminopeptidase N
MDAPILNFYSFLSARYAVRRDHWRGPDGRDVAIEIYYHPGHEYNLDRMVDGIKQSLSLYTRAFGPYQFRQVRILEFPRYASFAQSFPNTIPYSEAIGFIARVRDKNEDVDYPFYVTAHEVAHQWWAHQVIGANVQGGTMLVETLAEYSALLVMQKELGPVQVKRFLRYNLDEYLQGRTFERKKEMPLARVENQQYIHYRKGSLAMFALADYLGADVVNGALARFLAEHRFEQPPYATSEDLLRHLRAAAPDSMRYLVTDLFETITLWNDRAKSATATRLPDGRYRVTLEVEAHKVRVDSIGNEREIPMNDLVEVGVFAAPEPGQTDGAPLYLAKHRVRTGSSSITVEVSEKPARAGIDPLFKLIDRDTRDNTVPVTEVAAKKP